MSTRPIFWGVGPCAHNNMIRAAMKSSWFVIIFFSTYTVNFYLTIAHLHNWFSTDNRDNPQQSHLIDIWPVTRQWQPESARLQNDINAFCSRGQEIWDAAVSASAYINRCKQTKLDTRKWAHFHEYRYQCVSRISLWDTQTSLGGSHISNTIQACLTYVWRIEQRSVVVQVSAARWCRNIPSGGGHQHQ